MLKAGNFDGGHTFGTKKKRERELPHLWSDLCESKQKTMKTKNFFLDGFLESAVFCRNFDRFNTNIEAERPGHAADRSTPRSTEE